MIKVLDERGGETLYEITTCTDDTISVLVCEDDTEYCVKDWQGTQPKTFDEVPYFEWMTFEELVASEERSRRLYEQALRQVKASKSK